jgi:hypothetical protein
MGGGPPLAHHVRMTAQRPAVRRLVLVPSKPSGRGDELIRRYRLARVGRMQPPPAPAAPRALAVR